MKTRIYIILLLIAAVVVFGRAEVSVAKLTGVCSNCHTMHNSQDGTSVSATGPNNFLLVADCLGCHAMGKTNRIETIGTSQIPQVLHTDPIDLAGGNFAYITGQKGPGADDSYGHNVIDFGLAYREDVLFNPPGAYHAGQVTADELTCAGKNGCHGIRDVSTSGVSGIRALKGAHHKNVDGQLDVADQVWNSYRFLYAVKGYEVADWQNTSSTSHNEYFGASTPMNIDSCVRCHPSSNVSLVRPESQTISGFCATCHGNFHSVDGIGGDTVSPFKRHPTDIVLPNRGEFSTYTTYNIDAPVARPVVPTAPSSTVQPGDSTTANGAIVMCLSCHKAHATQYPDMLRWDYSTIVTGGTGGCHICHTKK